MTEQLEESKTKHFFRASATDFKKIPGSPVTYWVSGKVRSAFNLSKPIGETLFFRQGMATSDNDRFVRYHYEVDVLKSDRSCKSPDDLSNSKKKWFPFTKGGGYRKWHGFNDLVVNWKNNGQEMKAFTSTLPQGMDVRLKSRDHYCIENITYSSLTSANFSCRRNEFGFIFGTGGPCLFGGRYLSGGICLLNSKLGNLFLSTISQTLNFEMVDVKKIPFLNHGSVDKLSESLISISKIDYDGYEVSPSFQYLPLLCAATESTPTLESSYTAWITQNRDTIAEINRLEEENNRLFIDAYGLADELTTDVPIEQITLTVNPAYRYGKAIDNGEWTIDSGFGEELDARFRSDTIEELISYAIGCMMGRYSLDRKGLIYANSGNIGFDALVNDNAYATFPADEDGIIPITDQEWFADDSTNRFREFIRVAWDEEHLQENLDFVAESLCLHAIKPKNHENSMDTIRRYLSNQFYKSHLKTYKKRPIYWLFSSGKQKAFECLVYLHRYNEGTLARMRTEYVTPLMGKYVAQASQLTQQKENATSTADANRFGKLLTALEKKQAELSEFDAKLKHYADMRISLDLDDGVKVNYGKFGDLLVEVKAIHGMKPAKE